MALAGGVNLLLSSLPSIALSQAQMLSPDGYCKAFDSKANGFVRGEGCGAIVLKRLSDAVAAGDRIHAVIKGSAVTHNGASSGFTVPNARLQEAAMEKALAASGILPGEVGFVEAHGTGTAVGDPIELDGLASIYRRGRPNGENPLWVGSVKTNIGHLESAAGIASLIKLILCLKHRSIPPNLHFDDPNPYFDWDKRALRVPTSLHPWPSSKTGLYTGACSSFGASGTNVHMVVQGHLPEPRQEVQETVFLFPVSAQNREAHGEVSLQLAEYLEKTPCASLANVARTLLFGRRQMDHRLVHIASSRNDLVVKLRQRLPSPVSLNPGKRPRIVFLYSGQGGDYPGYGQQLWKEQADFREAIQPCIEAMCAHLDSEPWEKYLNGKEINEDFLSVPSFIQLLQFSIQYGLGQMLKKWGITPTAVMGHSLGEYAAACMAGILNLKDAVALLVHRGRIIDGLPGGAMTAIHCDPKSCEEYMGALSVAAINGEEHWVASGPDSDILDFERTLDALKIGHVRINVNRAFHSKQVQAASEEYGSYSKEVRLSPNTLPMVSGVSGTWLEHRELEDPGYWAKQMKDTVRFHDGVTLLLEQPSIFIEIGPGTSLLTSVRRHPNHLKAVCRIPTLSRPKEGQSESEAMLKVVGRLWELGWMPGSDFLDRFRTGTIEDIPPYPFDRKSFWFESKNVARLRQRAIQENLESGYELREPIWKVSQQTGRHDDREDDPGNFVFVESLHGKWTDFPIDLLGSAVHGSRLVPYCDRINRQSYAEYASKPSCTIFYRWQESKRPGESATTDFGNRDWSAYQDFLEFFKFILKLRTGLDVRLIIVTGGAPSLLESNASSALSMTLALLNVAAQENPKLQFATIDPGQFPDARWQLLRKELALFEPFSFIAYSGEHRHILAYPKLENGEKVSSGLKFHRSGVYILTGGLGRIGRYLAKYLMDHYEARVILTTRQRGFRDGDHPVIDPEDWELIFDQEKRDFLQDFKENKNLLIVSADLGSEKSVRNVLDQAMSSFGQIDGIFHGAGFTGGDCFLSVDETGWSDLELYCTGKADGAINIWKALESTKVNCGFVVLMSSLSTILGGLGHGAYSSANAFLNSFVRNVTCAKRSTVWICIEWDTWDIDLAAKLGKKIAALRPEHAILALEECLAISTQNRQIIAAASSFEERRRRWLRGESASHHLAADERKEEEGDQSKTIGRKVTDLCQGLLKSGSISLSDNFFDMGGDSLTGAKFISMLQEEFMVTIPLKTLIEATTIFEIVELIEILTISSLAAPADEQDQIEIKI